MAEAAEANIESFSVQEASRDFDAAKAKLFGIGFRDSPKINIDNSDEAKGAIRDVVNVGLTLARTERVIARKKSSSGIHDIERRVVEYERALDVVDGKRKTPDSLISVITTLADEAKEGVDKRRTERLAELKSWGKKDDIGGEADYKKRLENISNVVRFVTQNASDWGNGKVSEIPFLQKAA